MNDRIWVRIGGIAGLLAVGLGAFGAHALKPRLLENGTLDTWQTAALYHLVHALAMLLPWSMGGKLQPCRWFLAGIVIFSGSLYFLSLTGWTRLGIITPVGGLCFMVGWLLLALRRPANGDLPLEKKGNGAPARSREHA